AAGGSGGRGQGERCVNLDDELERIVRRHEELAALMSAAGPQDAQGFARTSKEYAELTPGVEAIGALRKAQRELADAEALMRDLTADPDMKALAEEEVVRLRELVPALDRQVKVLLLPKDEADARNAILEVRAGTGGEEAALFAAELFRMYLRYAELHGWKTEIMSINETGLGGYKEAIATISGRDVFARLKFES